MFEYYTKDEKQMFLLGVIQGFVIGMILMALLVGSWGCEQPPYTLDDPVIYVDPPDPEPVECPMGALNVADFWGVEGIVVFDAFLDVQVRITEAQCNEEFWPFASGEVVGERYAISENARDSYRCTCLSANRCDGMERHRRLVCDTVTGLVVEE